MQMHNSISKPLNILHIISSSNIGGSPVHTLLLCEELKKMGHRSILVYPSGGSYESKYQESGIELRPYKKLNPWNVFLYQDLVQFIKKEKIDIIHTHELKSDWMGYILYKFTGCPVVTTIHNMITHSRLSPLKKSIYCSLSRKIYNSISGVIAVSNAVKNNLQNELKIKQSRINVIHNGTKMIDPGSLENPSKIRHQYHIPVDIPLLICIGRLIPLQKGQEYLIQSLPTILLEYPTVHLLIIGDGIIRPELESLTRKLNLEKHITFTGWCNNIPDLLYASDICVVPSLWDPMPRIVLEAMMVGKPVVASNIDGIKESVVHRQTGILVEPGNSIELAKSLIELLQNPDSIKIMGKKAREHVLQNFTSERHAHQTLDFYRTVLGELKKS